MLKSGNPDEDENFIFLSDNDRVVSNKLPIGEPSESVYPLDERNGERLRNGSEVILQFLQRYAIIHNLPIDSQLSAIYRTKRSTDLVSFAESDQQEIL